MSLLDYDRCHVWHPYASMVNPPPVNLAVSASGTKIRLDSGEELIDAVSSWWCVVHGHNHPAIMEAIRKQTEKLSQVMFAGFTHEPAIRLTEALVHHLPEGMDKVFYVDSGSIAVECAAKMAVQYQYSLGFPEKSKLLALKGGYHGDTAAAMALSDPSGMHALYKGVMPKHFFAEKPRCRFDGPWEDSDFDSVTAQLDAHGSEIAGIICEPIFQGGNAMWFYHPEYLRRLRKICNERGILLIFDEIATGFGRTGRKFAQEYASVVPDIMCIGKILTGGQITLAATVTNGQCAEVICRSGGFCHGPTFMANPLACAAGIASMKLLDEYDYLGNVRRIESELKAELECCRHSSNVADIRALGAVGVLEVHEMPSREKIQRIVLDSGVWLRPVGNYIYTMPPYITTTAEIHQIVQAMKAVAEAV